MSIDPNWRAVEPEPDREAVQAQRRLHPLRMDSSWLPAEPDPTAIRARFADPLAALATAQTPALILRGAYPAADCAGLIQRFIDRGLMPAPDAVAAAGTPRQRIDIGTSLGNRGDDQEAFLQHAASTHELFRTLFAGFANPIDAIYGSLAALANGKQVANARQPDGRAYGPAIFRIHYGDHAYAPHFDSVRLREKRISYAVSRFQHQFAGILCLQNDTPEAGSTQTIIHRCLWTPEVQPQLAAGTFPAYAAEHGIGCRSVGLQPGDLYFFNTQCIHEVPALLGRAPRIVLAVFIGYSPDDREVLVWS
ncbi:MAG: hypothetical protein ACHQ4G_04205 [Opitutales bacterium]